MKVADPKPPAAISPKAVTFVSATSGDGFTPQGRHNDGTNLLEEELIPEDVLGGVATDDIEIEVTLDSGAVRNVCNRSQVPRSVEIKPNQTGKNFVGPGGEIIANHGTCATQLTSGQGKVGCNWGVADVTRSLHAVSSITGPVDKAQHDVLFTNQLGVVVPAGVVDEILKRVKPIATYPRKGNLYCAKMTTSGFPRPGAVQ